MSIRITRPAAQRLDKKVILQGCAHLIPFGEIHSRSQGTDRERGAAVGLALEERRLIEACPQGVVRHLLERLARVERLLAQLAQQGVVDGEARSRLNREAQAISRPRPRRPTSALKCRV
ncbi:MAG: hypothetical protein WBN89_10750 [Prochlorococcaceae cyanobacterium]